MTEEIRPDRVELRLGTLRALGPPQDARARVFASVTERARSRRRRKTIALSAAALVGVALLFWFTKAQWLETEIPQPAPAPQIALALPPRPVTPPAPVTRTVHLATDELLTLASANLVARGPASLEMGDGPVVLDDGTLIVDGALEIRGGTCSARIDGRCSVTRFERTLRFVVEAGEVEMRSPATTCSIVDLEAPAPEPAPHRRPRQADPTELLQQTEAYRQALSLQGHDDEGALRALRAMGRRWPRGSLAPEVDFQTVRTLVHMGRDADARAAAQVFLRRHPRSARVAEMRRLVEGGGQ